MHSESIFPKVGGCTFPEIVDPGDILKVLKWKGEFLLSIFAENYIYFFWHFT